ncbi:MAG TPA: erythromycin esterase family protein [Chloroflexota bacterium]|nr:erythromycin esterase family protein [Chloroflexota bacterium]
MARQLRSRRPSGGDPVAPLAEAFRSVVQPLEPGAPDELDPVLDLIGNASLVMLGEGSHGTHEFYDTRQRITQRLIDEKGFRAIAIEGDWPDAARVDQFVKGGSGTARSSLDEFRSFPTWMWGNQDVVRFVRWLREFNDRLPDGQPRCGFYGLDLYSMYASMEAVIAYLERADPAAAETARARFACFEPVNANMQVYALLVHAGSLESCEQQVLEVLHDLRRRREEIARQSPDYAFFSAEQNVLLTRAAENFYRAMLRGDPDSWNVRDCYMFDTLLRLRDHLGTATKLVVWAHNTHVGDYRATDQAAEGYVNLGQLARERFDDDVFLLGFGTYAGTVTAASAWGGPPELKEVPAARAGTYEDVLHQLGLARAMVPSKRLRGQPAASLFNRRQERAIGVVYHPAYESHGNYFKADLANQFDAYVYIDRTSAVKPIWIGFREAGAITRRAA